jgi:hypothetical protein
MSTTKVTTSMMTGLGTAATLNTGTAAGNIPVLDGSARMPAVDGSQLTNTVGGTLSNGSLSSTSTTLTSSVTSAVKRIVIIVSAGSGMTGLRLGDAGGLENSGYTGQYSSNGAASTTMGTTEWGFRSTTTEVFIELMRVGSTDEWVMSLNSTLSGTDNAVGTGKKATSAATTSVAIIGSAMSGTYSIALLTA